MTNTTLYLTEIPSLVAEALGTSEFVAGIICSVIIYLIFLLPILILKRSKAVMSEIIVGIAITCALIGLTWLPYWVGLILALIVTVLISTRVRDWIGG